LRFDIKRAPLLLGGVALVLALHGLGSTDITGDDEAREAGIVQDILAGHVLWPRFNADLIPDKPTLYHWVAAIPCTLAGFSAAAVRLPSAVAAAGLIAWVTWFGARVLGTEAGIAAGILMATFPVFFDHARVARPDVLMLLLLAPALGCAFTAWRERRRRDAELALVLLGLATLAKGPVAPALFVATMGGFAAWQRDARPLRALVTPIGIAALLVLGLGWYVLAYAGWGQEFVRQHLVGRYLRNLAGGLAEGRPYSERSLVYHLTFYPLHLPAVALPWTPLVVAALVRLARRRGFTNPLVRFLVVWSVAPIVVFTPAEWKLRYYLLPSLPPLALLTAPLAVELLTRRPEVLRATRASLVAAAAVLAVGGAVTAIALARPDLLARSDEGVVADLVATVPGGAPVIAALVGTLLGVGAVATALRLWGPLVAVTGALTLGWIAVGAPAMAVQADAGRSLRTFAEAALAHFPGPTALAFYGEPVRSIVVYVGHPVRSLDRSVLDITPGLGVIAPEPAYRVLAARGHLGPPLATGSGQTGNLERGTLVVAEGLEKAP
jgi:4-amino-4-deoxy-L-arabinose transferase-like glycosyltransferase